jgi:hypothetical protein
MATAAKMSLNICSCPVSFSLLPGRKPYRKIAAKSKLQSKKLIPITG